VADGRTLKLLLVEDNLEDENLVREALIEVEETRQWGRWNSCYLAHVDTLPDALDCIDGEQFDAILLNLSLPDAPALLDTFLEARSRAGSAPIIVLADEDDPATAQRLIREGAQDVLVKSELECAQLARSIRHAIERQRRAIGLESSWFLDQLTGAYNRRGFLHVAAHHLNLARKFAQTVSLVVMDFPELSASKEASDLALIRAAEVSRTVFPDDCVVGRLEPLRLGLLCVGLSGPNVQTRAGQLGYDIRCALGDRAEPRFRISQIDHHDPSDIEEVLEDRQRKVAIPAMLAD
jgi:DNA-binding NarL/FixJ family response regulator